jgi:GMP synthase-like glutamine amidotransferase
VVEPLIGDVLATLREADPRGVGVFGVCFGAQAVAAAFGAVVQRSSRPELGWHEVEMSDPALVPPGPWFMWHSDTFALPREAREIARTDPGPQAYALGGHLCVQFHPEADANVVAAWMEHDPTDFTRAGIEPEAVVEETRRRGAAPPGSSTRSSTALSATDAARPREREASG